MLGYSLVVPLLVFLVTDFGGNVFVYGLVGTMYPLFQFFGAPWLGKLSDRIGRRRVLLISQIGTFVAWLLFIVSLLLPRTPIANIDSDWVGNFWLVLLGTIFLAINFWLLTFDNTSLIYVACVLLSLGNGLMWPSFLAILTQAGDPSKQGTIQGYANSTGSLASIIGLLLGGSLFGWIGPSIFWVACVIMVILIGLSLPLFRWVRASSKEQLAATGSE